jgi:hypothetical protein
MMKKILVMLVVFGFSITIFATEPFRFSGCSTDKPVPQRIELYEDGSCVFVDTDGQRLQGTYSWDRKSGTSGTITMRLEYNNTLRGDVSISDGFKSLTDRDNSVSITIEGTRFSKRNCQ